MIIARSIIPGLEGVLSWVRSRAVLTVYIVGFAVVPEPEAGNWVSKTALRVWVQTYACMLSVSEMALWGIYGDDCGDLEVWTLLKSYGESRFLPFNHLHIPSTSASCKPIQKPLWAMSLEGFWKRFINSVIASWKHQTDTHTQSVVDTKTTTGENVCNALISTVAWTSSHFS